MTSTTLSPGRYLKSVPLGSYVHVERVPGTRSAAKTAVSRAAANGELVPLRRGLYYKGKRTRYGVAKPPPEDIALEVLGRKGVGPTGVGAARALNLTTQVPVVAELVTSGPVPVGLPGVKVHKRNNVARSNLTYLEIAVLELLRNFEFTSESGWTGLVRAVAEKATRKDVRLDALGRAGSREPSRMLRDRLNSLLDAVRDESPVATKASRG